MSTEESGSRREPLKIRLALALIIFVSISARIAFHMEQREGPMARAHQMEAMDMKFFHEWANRIAQGDLLAEEAFHPYPKEHSRIAMEILTRKGWADPDHPPDDPARTLWNIWYNGKVFHQEPLYPYMAAAIYNIQGQEDPRGVYIAQMAAGVAINILIFLTTLRLFGLSAAMAAGALAALYGPFLFFEYTLLRTTLSSLAAIGLVCLGLVVMEKDRRLWWAAFGIVTGLCMMVRIYFVIFPAVVWLALARNSRPQALRGLAPLALGLFLALFPAMARNMLVGVNPLALAGNAALTFIDGNSPNFDPRDGLVRNWNNIYTIMARTDGKMTPTIARTIGAHDSALGYVALVARKFSASLSWYEIPNNINFYYYKSHSTILKLLPLTFFLVAPLCLVGIYLAVKDGKQAWPLLAMGGIVLFTMVVFFPLARYRIPMVAVLFPFAGYSIARAILEKKAMAILAVAVAAYWVFSSIPGSAPPKIIAADYSNAAAVSFLPRIKEAMASDDWETATGVYREWTSYEAEFGIDLSHPENTSAQILVPAQATFRQYADVARKAGLDAEANAVEKKADILAKELGRRRYPDR